MAVMLSKTYQALKAAGVSDEQARDAAEKIAGLDPRLLRLEIKVNLVLGGVGLLLPGVLTLIIKAFL